MVLTASSFLARALVLPALGRIAGRHGASRLLWLGGLGIVPLPSLWLVSDAFAYLFCVQLVAGLAWAAVELATTLAFFEEIPEEDRAGVLTAFNFANACAIALGAVIGAWVLDVFAGTGHVYAWLFAISTAGRMVAAAFLRATPSPEHVGAIPQMRTLTVGPSGATVQRPILASLDAGGPAGAGPRPGEAGG
jgi:MFS family permease